jgi:hypothetical protein
MTVSFENPITDQSNGRRVSVHWFVATLSDLLEFMRQRLPWLLVIAGGAGLLAVLVAGGEVDNWGVFLRFLYHVP